MILKIAFLVILACFVISLGSGLFFLFADDKQEKKRLFNSLGVRVTLAVLMIILLTYGVLSGQIKSQAPWAKSNQPTAVSQ